MRDSSTSAVLALLLALSSSIALSVLEPSTATAGTCKPPRRTATLPARRNPSQNFRPRVQQRDPRSPVQQLLRQPKPEPVHIALGRTKSRTRGNILDKFATRVGGVSWQHWQQKNLVDPTEETDGPTVFAKHFEQVLNTAVTTGGTIHFNLTELDVDDAFTRVHYKKWPQYSDLTQWELRSIAKKEKWLKNTVFYRNGRKIANQDQMRDKLRKLKKGIRSGEAYELRRKLTEFRRKFW